MPRRKKEIILSDNDDDDIDSKFYKQPIQRSAANARERARMRVLSKAFTKLKTTLPWVPADTKLSKLDTLRLASNYIGHLRHILSSEEEEDHGQPPFIHPLNLTWPYSFSGKSGSGSEGKSPDHAKLNQDESVSSPEDLLSC